ncbi:hypothetical protein [Lacrimispora sp.]|uniref:hypothetical protein n=1 Tax=Lacrimispora sp. TaxID=2719234 RepID=UPI002FD90474
MIQKRKTFISLIVILSICLLSSFIFFNKQHDSNNSLLTILKITDLESYLKQHDITFPATKNIHLYNLDDTNILIIDNRNSDYSLYINSSVTAKINDGILTVTVKDSNAISETDISGVYGVIIQCDGPIANIIIQKEH